MLSIVACGYLLILTFHKEAKAAAFFLPVKTSISQKDTVPAKTPVDTSAKKQIA